MTVNKLGQSCAKLMSGFSSTVRLNIYYIVDLYYWFGLNQSSSRYVFWRGGDEVKIRLSFIVMS
jgi:hypothetical protein